MISYCCAHLLNFLLMPGMKVYTTDEKELIMEPTLKWAGNPNILVAIKAFGLRATVQVLTHFFVMGPTVMRENGCQKKQENKGHF